MKRHLNLTDPSRLRPPPNGFECGETIDEDGDVGSVSFFTTTPNNRRLIFSCRGRSIGVLVGDESAVKDEDLEEANSAVDPNFFDPGYGLAGKTGFQIWAGSRLLLESLTWPQESTDDVRLIRYQQRIASGARVLELGAGVGVVGTSLAAAGGQILLTDLPTLIDNATRSNLCLNENDEEHANVSECPSWLKSANAVPIGHGWASTASLDWTSPVEEQLSTEQREGIDIVVASDCVWLVAMLDALLDTVECIFDASAAKSPAFLMSFQQRDPADGNGSIMFTTVVRVIESVRSRNWSIECLAWRAVTVSKDEEEKEVFVFEITKKC